MIIPSQEFQASLSVRGGTQRKLNQDISELIYWLQQELLSPELLKYFNVAQIHDALKVQKQQISTLKSMLSKDNRSAETLYLTLHVIEIDRIEFFYHQYLRARLQKLITNGFYYYNSMNDYNLSQQEIEFLKNMVEEQINHVFVNCLQFYEKSLRGIGVVLETQNKSQSQGYKIGIYLFYLAVPQPDFNKYVFIYIRTLRTIHIGQIALSKGDCALVCYDDVKLMVPLKSVTLI